MQVGGDHQLEEVDRYLNRPIHHAAEFSQSVDVVACLLAHGPQPQDGQLHAHASPRADPRGELCARLGFEHRSGRHDDGLGSLGADAQREQREARAVTACLVPGDHLPVDQRAEQAMAAGLGERQGPTDLGEPHRRSGAVKVEEHVERLVDRGGTGHRENLPGSGDPNANPFALSSHEAKARFNAISATMFQYIDYHS